MRAIRALLYELLQQGTPPSTSPPPNPDPPSRDAMPPITHPPPGQKVDPIDARRQFYKDAGPAITSGLLSANDVNELAKLANDTGWPGALAQLHHARTVAELYQPDR